MAKTVMHDWLWLNFKMFYFLQILTIFCLQMIGTTMIQTWFIFVCAGLSGRLVCLQLWATLLTHQSVLLSLLMPVTTNKVTALNYLCLVFSLPPVL